MRRLIYSFQVSLDGYIADRDGKIDALTPDDEVHRFHNEQAREVGVHLYGRRLYETMRFWETVESDPEAPGTMLEFAAIWKATEKIVFSRTLNEVDAGMTLARGEPAEEVARLKAEDGGDISVGGAGLAAGLVERGLVDEYRLVTYPVVFGGGTPFFPALEAPLELELAETRAFASGVVYSRYLAALGG